MELVAVQVEGVDCGVEVVEYDLDDCSRGDDEWVDVPVDDGVGVVFAGGEGCEEGRHFLGYIGIVVE